MQAWFVFFATFVAMASGAAVIPPRTMATPIGVSRFLQGVKSHDFDEVYFTNDRVYSVTKTTDEANTEGADVDASSYVYSTNISPYVLPKLMTETIHAGLDPVFVPSPLATTTAPPGIGDMFFSAVYSFVAITLVINLVRAVLGRNNGGATAPGNGFNPFSTPTMNPGRSMNPENVTLSDWAGSPEVLVECSEVITYLKNREQYEKVGAKIPKGVLMVGPPGTGKTLLAKAIANEADAHFIEMSASEFIEMYVGLGALRVRRLFEDARKNAPCVVFIDEIDAVGKRRSTGEGPVSGGNDERDQTLNQLLAEMDGFRNNTGVLVLAATNRQDILDPALVRPGRFDRIVNIPLPDTRSRKKILELYLKGLPAVLNGTDVAGLVDKWAKLTKGFSGADLKNVVNEAAILLARRSAASPISALTDEMLSEAWEKQAVGIKKQVDDRSPEVKRRVAIHEMGHAWMAHTFPQYFDVLKVSIRSTYSGAGGYTLFSEKEETVEGGLYTRDMLVKRIMVALGGKAAEEVYYGAENVSVGASMDLSSANALAVDMIEKYGMGTRLNVFSKGQSSSFFPKYSEYTQKTIDREAGDIVKEAYQTTLDILRANRSQMDGWVERLIVEVDLSGEQLDASGPFPSPLLLPEPTEDLESCNCGL